MRSGIHVNMVNTWVEIKTERRAWRTRDEDGSKSSCRGGEGTRRTLRICVSKSLRYLESFVLHLTGTFTTKDGEVIGRGSWACFAGGGGRPIAI